MHATGFRAVIRALAATAALTLASCCCARQEHALPVAAGEARVVVTALVDGTGRFVFTPDSAHYAPKQWGLPTDVRIDGELWTDLDRTPARWREITRGLDLSAARLVERHGRDTIALERTADGFDLYVCDSLNGAAPYEVTIVIPRRG
jgi:hypothetical protein